MSLWDELALEFYAQQEKHFPRGLHRLSADPCATPDALQAAQTSTSPTLDAAVLAYSETGCWPILSTVQQTMMCERLLYAAEWISLLEPPGFDGRPLWPAPRPPLPRKELIRWLLVDLWHAEGFPTIRSMSAALRPDAPSASASPYSAN